MRYLENIGQAIYLRLPGSENESMKMRQNWESHRKEADAKVYLGYYAAFCSDPSYPEFYIMDEQHFVRYGTHYPFYIYKSEKTIKSFL